MLTAPRLLWAAIRAKAELVHFHDLELLGWAAVFSPFCRARFVYDAHEHYPDQVREKYWLPTFTRGVLSKVVDLYEGLLVPRMDAVVAADDALGARYAKWQRLVLTLPNFPLLGLFPWSDPDPASTRLVYVGSVSSIRGAEVMLEAVARIRKHHSGICLEILGNCHDPVYRCLLLRRIRELGLTEHVELHDPVPHLEVRNHIQAAVIGLCPLCDIPKFHKNVPTKLFEYMACGRAVVASRLPTTTPYLPPTAGILVEPGSPLALAEAVIGLLDQPDRCRNMGRQGRRLVETRYNWARIESRLGALYAILLGTATRDGGVSGDTTSAAKRQRRSP